MPTTHMVPLGELSPDEDIEEWLVSQPIETPLFPGHALSFVLEDLADDPAPSEVESAVASFLALPADTRDKAAPHVFECYRQVVDAVGSADAGPEITAAAEVWRHIRPTGVHVKRRSEDGKVYVAVEAECSWEPEHGLQLVFRQGRELNRVSAQDDHLTYSDAYDVPDSEDRIV